MRSALNIWEHDLGTLSLNSQTPVAFGHQWRFLPSRSYEVIADEAKKSVYQYDNFTEFQMVSGLPYAEAAEIWEAAWESYEEKENIATGN